MTALLYISYSSALNKNDKLTINKQVPRNQNGIKKIVTAIVLGGSFYFSNVQPSMAMGLRNVSTIPLLKIQSDHRDIFEMEAVPTIDLKSDKIIFVRSRESPVCVYMIDKRFLEKSGSLKVINKIRAGGLVEVGVGLIVIVFMWKILGLGIEGFMVKNPDYGWEINKPSPFKPPVGHFKYPSGYNLLYPKKTPGLPRSRSMSMLEISRPSSMPHQQFTTLSKQEKRALPHNNDMYIVYEKYPKLTIGFWQSQFKVANHGAIHDLPYIIKANGSTKTPKTDDNTLKMMKLIVDMPNRENIIWFENGTYQGGTDRGFDSIHIYDADKQIIAVFKKSNGKFVTTCQLDGPEHEKLLKTGNFGGVGGLSSGQVKNLPPQQTTVNTLENDVTKMIPIHPINENSSPGFTSASSFEDDVMSITPINKTQFDNP